MYVILLILPLLPITLKGFTVCKLIYLPPYSPDFNPIEMAFSSVKAHLRRHADATNLCVSDIANACHAVTPKMAQGWFQASGYM